MASKDEFTRGWITQNSIEIVEDYEDGVLTLRALHYQLVSRGMTNSINHYKRVVKAMIAARWDGSISFEKFSDHDREVLGETAYEETTVAGRRHTAEWAINHYCSEYRKNRWENQDTYLEVWIEKKALQGVVAPVCNRWNVALCPCKGYPSLTFIKEATIRFGSAQDEGKQLVILYFGDYDASGVDIPRSIQENFIKFGIDIHIDVRALTKEQVIEMNLPPAPTKSGDPRAAGFDGLGQVELDAVDPKVLQRMISDSIEVHFDTDKYDELKRDEKEERKEFQERIKDYVINMFEE